MEWIQKKWYAIFNFKQQKESFQRIQQYQKGHFIKLFILILSISFISLFFSVVMRNATGLDVFPYFVVYMTFQTCIVLVNNIMYCGILKRVRNEKMKFEDIVFYFYHFLPQICCIWIISIIQTLAMSFLLPLLSTSIIFGQLISIILSLFFLLLNINIAFLVYDKEFRIIVLLKRSLQNVKTQWSQIYFPCSAMVLWTFLDYMVIQQGTNIGLQAIVFGISVIIKLYIFLYTADIYENK